MNMDFPNRPLNHYAQPKHTNNHQTNHSHDSNQHKLQQQYLSYTPMIAQKTNQRNVFKDYYSSSYKDHYQAPQDHYSRFKSIGRQVMNKGNGEAQTTYKKEFKEPPQFQARLLNPELDSLVVPNFPMYPSTQKEIKFTGQSRYKEDFIDVPKMDEIRLVNSEKITRKEMKQQKYPFYGQSTYNQMFKPFAFQGRIQNTAQNVYTRKKYEPKFEETSSYTKDYNGFKIQLPRKQTCQLHTLPISIPKLSNNKSHLYYDSINQKFL